MSGLSADRPSSNGDNGDARRDVEVSFPHIGAVDFPEIQTPGFPHIEGVDFPAVDADTGALIPGD